MVGNNIRAEAIALMDKRAGIEAQIEAITGRLTVPGGPGLTGNLLDKDGFPRADIDIPNVRADRHRLAALHYDHKQLTVKIEKIIYELHSIGPTGRSRDAAPSPGKHTGEGEETRTTPLVPAPLGRSAIEAQPVTAPGTSAEPSGAVPMEEDIVAGADLRPFAVIDEVTPGSPADVDGIRLGDQMLQFGNVAAGPSCIQLVARELQSCTGCSVPVLLLRRGQRMQLQVTPRQWSGRGLLGCHLQPIR